MSEEVLRERRVLARGVVAVAFAALVLSALVFTVGNHVGPAAARAWSEPARERGQGVEPMFMDLAELRRRVLSGREAAEAAEPGSAASRWQLANRLAWHYVRRTDGSVLPILFAVIGVLAGYWGRWSTGRLDLRRVQHWALGLFLVVSAYLAGENSYELLVLRSAGPVFYAGDLVLVVPAALALGLGWPIVFAARWTWAEGEAGEPTVGG